MTPMVWYLVFQVFASIPFCYGMHCHDWKIQMPSRQACVATQALNPGSNCVLEDPAAVGVIPNGG